MGREIWCHVMPYCHVLTSYHEFIPKKELLMVFFIYLLADNGKLSNYPKWGGYLFDLDSQWCPMCVST